ncbi:MAG TPA: hypothetical protein VHH73_18290 [Verrucomicrobiae bacterium]|nr:hypothetical protein [Verrucomicrobiae bacterium]
MTPMRSRAILVVSLVVNVALTGGIVFLWPRPKPRAKPAWEVRGETGENAPATVFKTNIVVSKVLLTWKEIESRDYPTYIANLRNIGCPEATIRDIIVAEINQWFAHRRATEVLTADQQWWRLERDQEVIRAAMEKMSALEQERRALLARLLGPNWEQGTSVASMMPTGVALNGPVLGALSDDAKKSVNDINNRSRERLNSYYEEVTKAGRQPDPAEVARINQQARAELAQVLDAAQLEEYLLRYSDTANEMRRNLQGVNISPDEFRAMFRARDPYDQEVARYAGDDTASAQRRQQLEDERDAALKRALTPARYAEVKLNQDPDFQKTRDFVQQYGGAPEAVMPMFEVNAATQKEIEKIRGDRSLSQQQQNDALEAIQAAQQQSLRQLLGEQGYQRYLQGQAPAAGK